MSKKRKYWNQLNELLIKYDLSQAEFSRIMGWCESRTSRYLSGECNPQADTIIAICRKMNCSADYLLGLVKQDIVRCENCIYWEQFPHPEVANMGWCKNIRCYDDCSTEYNFYCAYGEKKEV